MDPKSGQAQDPPRRARLYRRDLLTGASHALREMSSRGANVVIGCGQGGLIATLLGHPLVVEAALSSKAVSAEDALAVARAWVDIRLALVVAPWMLKCVKSTRDLRLAVPELFAPVPEGHPRWSCVGLLRGIAGFDNPHHAFAEELCRDIVIPLVGKIPELELDRYLELPPLTGVVEDASGRCQCGRAVRLVARCRACAEAKEQEQEPEAEVEPVDDAVGIDGSEDLVYPVHEKAL